MPEVVLTGASGRIEGRYSPGKEAGAPIALILHGSGDTVVPPIEVERVVSKLRTQKGIVIDYEVVPGATHFWAEHLPEVEQRVGAYLDKRLAADPP